MTPDEVRAHAVVERQRIVALRVLAAETATAVPCRFCGQGVGQACVTRGLNEAAFTHAIRLRDRRAELGDA